MKTPSQTLLLTTALATLTLCSNANATLITGDFSGYVYNSFSSTPSLSNGFADGKRVRGNFRFDTALAQVADRDLYTTSATYQDDDLRQSWVSITWTLESFDVENLFNGTHSYDKVFYSNSPGQKDRVEVYDYEITPAGTGDSYIAKSFFIDEWEQDILQGLGLAQTFQWSDPAQGCGDAPNTFQRCAFFNFTQRGNAGPYTFVNAWLDTVNFYGVSTPTQNVPEPTSILLLLTGLLGVRKSRKGAR